MRPSHLEKITLELQQAVLEAAKSKECFTVSILIIDKNRSLLRQCKILVPEDECHE